ncbi:hypothetical protein IGI04_036290 [Brassica rapa subsp. trilocularis]|uniref:Uncharacterized protein n=1 Tax=Brassica rapa subsp. trilocularis TaxID=1813537 RepID=A0ABQ7LGT9_BRACM|nr:hypothetical protein IGI04_036290 [Brassica rapa subsp. trilocularis]
MANADPFSMSTMLNSLQHIRFASTTEPIEEDYYHRIPPSRCIPVIVPPPKNDQHLINSFSGGFLTPHQELETRLQSMFD